MKKITPLLFRRRGEHRPAASGPLPERGAADQFKRLILPHLDGAYNLASYLTGDPVLSQDIVQDAFVRAFRGFSQYRGGSPRAWLFAIVRNCCRTAQRARSPLTLVVNETDLTDAEILKIEAEPDSSPSPEDEIIRRTEADCLRTAIEGLPQPFREAIVLREIEDLSYAEIAQVSGVPIGTVMSRLARGRSMLAEQLLPPSSASYDQSRSAK